MATKYQSKYKEQMDQISDQIVNRDPFVFDVNEDGLYDQLKDQYVSQGKMAMMDTMGQAADLTGGYGSSYAQQAGQQAYQGYLQGLNDVVPELYQMALDKYTREGDALQEQYALLADQDERDYARYLDELDQQLQEQQLAQQSAKQAKAEQLERAEFLAEMFGDYSGYQAYYGLSDREMQQYLAMLEDQNAKGGYYDDSKPLGYDFDTSDAEFTTLADGHEYVPAQKDYKEVNNENTDLFKASVMTKSEYRRLGTHVTYNDYLESQLDKWLSDGKLNANEAATLIAYYGL